MIKWKICVKQVVDVNSSIRVRHGEIIYDPSKVSLNAYDASSVEEVLKLCEKYGGEIELISIGQEKSVESLRKGLAMGAHQASHIFTEENYYPSYVYAKILAKFLKSKEYDIIVCGKQSQDTDNGITGGMLAQYLQLPYAHNLVGLDLNMDNNQVIATRQADSGQERIALPTPCVIACSNDMNEPRIPTLRGIMQSKRIPISKHNLEDIIPSSEIGLHEKIVKYENIPTRPPGIKWEDSPEEMVTALVESLKNKENLL